MDKLRIQMIGRKDGNGKKYYVSTCEAPISVNLDRTVIHLFPDENPENPDEFWGDLVIRKYDGKHARPQPRRKQRRYRRNDDDEE